MIQRNNICTTVSRYRGFYGTLWSMVLKPQGFNVPMGTYTKVQSSSGLIASTFYKFRSIIRFVFGKAPQELRQRILNSQATLRHTTPSNVTLRSPFISKLVTGNKRITLGESYFKHSQRFRNINKRYLVNNFGFSFALIGFYARNNGNPVLDDLNAEENDVNNDVNNGLQIVNNVETVPGRVSTWQKAFNIVKNHHFQLQEIRDDIDAVEKIDFQDKISKGCNGVVYQAEIGPSQQEDKIDQNNDLDQEEPPKKQKVAVKMLFNYDTESNSTLIINSFIKETLPYQGNFGQEIVPAGTFHRKSLSPHPNIVKILSVFAAEFKLLPGCKADYPKAIPAKFGGWGRNMTLFIVERLYDMSLKDYLANVPQPKRNHSLGMLCQLLDGVDFLHRNQVAHRDLKPDNILVKISDMDSDLPWLVITDFGLASTSLRLPYNSDEIGKGGNLALMAPEIKNAVPGSNRFLDYCRSDVWAVGAIAYELFGAKNPFYRRFRGDEMIDSGKYLEKNLPEFPCDCKMLKALVRSILSVDPIERPSPSFASTFCHLLLYMGAKNLRRLSEMKNDRIRCAITRHWWSAFMSELITQTWNVAQQTLTPNEHQLRVHFVTNVNARQIVETVNDCRFYVE